VSKPGLSKKQRKRVGRYVRDVADGLNLRDWTFEIMHEPISSDQPTAAAITTTFGRHFAQIEFSAQFPHLPPHTQREVIVHEVIHCWLPSARPLYWGLEELLGEPTLTVFKAAYRQEVELVVDGLANAIAPSFPLPKL